MTDERIRCREKRSGYVVEVVKVNDKYKVVDSGPYRKPGGIFSEDELDFDESHIKGDALGDIVRVDPQGHIYGFSNVKYPVRNIRVKLHDLKCSVSMNDGSMIAMYPQENNPIETLTMKVDFSNENH